VSIRKPELGPLGETRFEASVLATVAASLVNRPAGGCVESVLTLETHRFFLRTGMGTAILELSVMFEILNSFLVILRSFSGGKSSQIAALASLGIFFARVQTVFAGFHLANHKAS
jgi:hypothetical protein